MANNTYYNIYRSNTIELVRSLIYKCDFTAKIMNSKSRDSGLTVLPDRKEWRYYKHLSGNYHEVDDLMTITSLDTGETVVFNKDILKSHKKTRNLYKTQPEYTRELSTRYPEQTILIHGILYPTDINKAIGCKDGTILHYNKKYVEPQETYLIPCLEDAIRSIVDRVAMDSYLCTEELVPAIVESIIITGLVLKTISLRDKYVKTIYTHSYHIANYLASYNRIDEFMDYLTHPQQLFLYMNIDYLVRHTGHTSNFDLLVDKILTPHNLPTYDYTLRQNIIDVDKSLSPVPIFVRNKLNMTSGINVRDLDVYQFHDIMYKEIPSAQLNDINYAHYSVDSFRLSSQSKLSQLPTKIVEISAVDPEDVESVKFPETLISEWLYHATNGTYQNIITIINPLNGDPIKLPSRDAFMLFWYAYIKGFHNVDQKKIYPLKAFSVAKHYWVSEMEYRKVLPYDPFEILDSDIDFFIDSNVEITEPMLIAYELFEYCERIVTNARTRKIFIENAMDMDRKAERECMYSYSYDDVWCDISGGEYNTYQELQAAYGLEPKKYDNAIWQDLALDILEKSTAIGESTKISVRDIQHNMIRLIERLSSYTIQLLEEVTSSEVIVISNTTIMPGHISQKTDSYAVANIGTIASVGCKQASNMDVDVDMPTLDMQYVDIPTQITADVDLTIAAGFNSGVIAKHTITLENITVELPNAK